MAGTVEILGFVENTLTERAIRYALSDGPTVSVPHGSAEVSIEFDDLGGSTVVRVSAVVLDELDLRDGDDAGALRAINDRNRTLRFGKFVLEADSRRITLEYDLLGGFLQPEEVVNAVTSVAQMADEHDDRLLRELGSGRRAVDR